MQEGVTIIGIPLLMAYLRVQAAVLVFPALSERVVPVRVRAAIAMGLTPVALALAGETGRPVDVALMDLTLLGLREVLVGFLIAVPARIMALSLHVVTSAIGATTSLSQLIGTGTEAAPHPIGNLMHMAGLATLMAMGLPLLLVDLLSQSYMAFPVRQLSIPGYIPAELIGLIVRSFVLALVLASPFILGGLLYQALTGIVSRVMPTLPVVFIGAPAIIMLALTVLAILSPTILSAWANAVFDHAYSG